MSNPTGMPGQGKVNAKAAATRVIDPLARLLLRLHVTPDMVTIAGTIGACASALILVPQGHLLPALALVSVFALFDLLDGTMARMSGTSGPWGAFLDSTLDRITDGAIFASLAVWAFGIGNDDQVAYLALYVAIAAQVVSYTRARAEGLGMRAAGGIAERTERLVIVGIAAILNGIGVPYALVVGMWILAVLTTITVLQRMWMVRRQAFGSQEPKGGAAA